MDLVCASGEQEINSPSSFPFPCAAFREHKRLGPPCLFHRGVGTLGLFAPTGRCLIPPAPPRLPTASPSGPKMHWRV